jgi:competence protein ComGC
MLISIICISILLCVSVFININLVKKFDKLEEIAQNSVDSLLENEKFLTTLKNRLLSQQSYLRQLDRVGAFESDDETGYFFKELKTIVNDISVFFGEKPLEDEKPSITQNENFQARFQKDY